MEDQKYFVPDILELRVGYVCNIRRESDNSWLNWLCIDKRAINSACHFVERGDLRTLVLTPKQIQEEGWYYIGEIRTGGSQFKKGRNTLIWSGFPEQIIQILGMTTMGHYGNTGAEISLYYGACRDINTLRYIQKLLNIK